MVKIKKLDLSIYKFISGNYDKIFECSQYEFPKKCHRDNKIVEYGYVVELFNANHRIHFLFTDFESAFYFLYYGIKEYNIWSHGMVKCAIERLYKGGYKDIVTLYMDENKIAINRNKTYEENLKILSKRSK